MVEIETTKGRIKGVQESNYQRFYGIPFAKPPVGDLRFREPQPMDPWDEVKDATKFGPIPIQNNPDGATPINQKEDEDCLYLNIWTPAADNKTRPVMFWIYGGGFITGASSRPRLNGANLAVHGDVVVINFNYRLGALGFINLPGITPNIGILDQIAALNWVRENIDRFGGDPNNITVFGESAGAGSVSVLLTNPATRGLFHKAIMESGSASPRDFAVKKGTETLFSKLRIEEGDIDALRQVPIKKLLRAQRSLSGSLLELGTNPFNPFVDGKIIPEHPLDVMRKGEAANVPIIIGCNKDEIGFLPIMLKNADEAKAKPIIDIVKQQFYDSGVSEQDLYQLIAIYKNGIEEEYKNIPYKYLDALLTDILFRIPIIRNLEAYVQHQPNAYMYIFTYGSRDNNMALHTIEIPFVFGILDTKDIADGGIEVNKDSKKLAENVMDAWVAFARTGNPNHYGLPQWPPYDLDERATMILGVESRVEQDPMNELRLLWDDLL